MSTPTIAEGFVDFTVAAANKPCKTWYKVFGDLKALQPSRRPLVALHGGPGVSSGYLEVLSDLTTSLAIPLVVYDQIGTGNSTHLPEKMGDTVFWTEQLFLDELDNLLAHLDIQGDYDILGHSWGGMLGARHAVAQPKGLGRLVLSDAPASMVLWVEAQNRLRAQLPQDVQDVLTKNEEAGTTDSEEYKAAVGVFYSRYLCTLNPMPASVLEGFAWIEKDPTVYLTMNGPSEFYITGPLKDWSIVDEVHKISVPTLLLNGRYDEAQDSVVVPFFRSIPKVKWFTFAESSHMPMFEERERYMEIVGTFLTDA
ncbi:hypothetical protein PLICRDRAFT_112677 [Plicaturopsis crispa FD-325 SS-3]|nr:hypothetical protein PLICRDRAFT_112677 [Plicaturopsis crispa FD-325 SS-3]